MCIPHAPINPHKSGGRVKREKEVKKTVAYDADARMQADPDFVDTRVEQPKVQEKKKNWLEKLLES